MKILFAARPNNRFPMNLFETCIRHSWNIKQPETEEQILNLFKQHPIFGLLGVKVLFTSYHGIFSIDLLLLDKEEHQKNAINNLCNQPASFDKILPIILPLRNSKLEGVREHLQLALSRKVFASYHEIIYKQIQTILGNSMKDLDFLKPIKEALDNYHHLKKLKESIEDLNPIENERDLMDLYFRLEAEERAKMMEEVSHAKGTFLETAKSTVIVRGNSWMTIDGKVNPLGLVETKMLVDGQSFLNPDLYEYNLNNLLLILNTSSSNTI
jgi:hypothetical protein